MKDFLIRLLGGVPKSELDEAQAKTERMRAETESFVEQHFHLYGNCHSGRGRLSDVIVHDGNKMIVAHSNTSIERILLEGDAELIHAPWVKNVYTKGLQRVESKIKEHGYDYGSDQT